MNRLEYYNRQKEDWDNKEVQDIREEYTTKEMTVSQIADIHRRTPGSVSHKLKHIGLISHFSMSRGYSDYKESNLYKEVIETSKRIDADKKLKNDTKGTVKTDKLSLMSPNKEITEMRREIAELKKDVKEILRLMNALYDFESQ